MKVQSPYVQVVFVLIIIGMITFSSSLNFDNQAYWTYDQTSGTNLPEFFDKIYNGTTQNMDNSNWVSGLIRNALLFDGDNEVVNMTTNPLTGVGDNNLTINLWINTTQTSHFSAAFHVGNNSGALTSSYIQIGTTSQADVLVKWEGAANEIALNGGVIVANTWQMITLTREGGAVDNWTLYLDSVAIDTGIKDETFGAKFNGGGTRFGASAPFTSSQNFTGRLDEFGIWNRTLNNSEIIELYNSGEGVTPDPQILTTLVSPTNGSIQVDTNVLFNVTVTPQTFNLTNATLLVWHDNGTLFNQTTNLLSGNVMITTQFNLTNFIADDFVWNVKSCQGDGNGDNCTLAKSNFTFEWRPFNITDIGFNAEVIETSDQNFTLNITLLDGFTIQSANLIYNGTIFEGVTTTNVGGDDFILSIEIIIPAGVNGFSTENRTFIWNLTIVEISSGVTTSISIDEETQKVNELLFGICSPTLIVPMLNFTMFNEIDGEEINATANATTFQATFLLGGASDNLLKNFTVNNISVNVNEFDFCTDDEDNIIFIDMVLAYTAEEFANKQYVISGGQLTNNTNEISLFLLPSNLAIEFFVTVQQDLFPLTDAIVNIQKFFIGEGLFKTVEIVTTDNTGKFVSFLDLNQDYRFTVIKNSEVLIIDDKSSICEGAPCELLISIGAESFNLLSGLDFYAAGVLYNISYNAVTDIVTFDFIDITGLATSFRMVITKLLFDQPSEIISDQQLFTSSGTMTFNMSGQDGDFNVELFISRSPFQFIANFLFSIQNFAGELGFIGILFAFFLIITVIFAFAFKPSMLVLSVPLILITTKFMGILSMGLAAIIAFTILAVVTFFALEQ